MKVTNALDCVMDKDTHDVVFVDSSGKELQLDASDYDELDVLDISYRKIAVIMTKKEAR